MSFITGEKSTSGSLERLDYSLTDEDQALIEGMSLPAVRSLVERLLHRAERLSIHAAQLDEFHLPSRPEDN